MIVEPSSYRPPWYLVGIWGTRAHSADEEQVTHPMQVGVSPNCRGSSLGDEWSVLAGQLSCCLSPNHGPYYCSYWTSDSDTCCSTEGPPC